MTYEFYEPEHYVIPIGIPVSAWHTYPEDTSPSRQVQIVAYIYLKRDNVLPYYAVLLNGSKVRWQELSDFRYE